MTAFLVCLTIVLCLTPVSAEHEEESQEKCVIYNGRCVQENSCHQLDENERDDCYHNCEQIYQTCLTQCETHYDRITATCEASCEDSSFFDFSCHSKCFQTELQKLLPNLPTQNVGIWQGVPLLGESESEEDGNALTTRDDSYWSSEDSEDSASWDDDGDIFGIWKKKRDLDWSWEEEDDGDIFGNWKDKRQTN